MYLKWNLFFIGLHGKSQLAMDTIWCFSFSGSYKTFRVKKENYGNLNVIIKLVKIVHSL